jgi:predicted AAA+ superfamily ATPase
MIPRNINIPPNHSFLLFGARQTGKSTLLKSIYNDRTWTVNLLHNSTFIEYSREPDLFRKQASLKLEQKLVDTIIIDEVQKIPELLSEVHALIDDYPSCRFILTGSSARKLKRGGADLLAGRALERRLFPLTYLELKDKYDLNTILLFGTLPPVVNTESSQEKQDILSTYATTYLTEEIKAEGLSRNIGGFSRFLELAADHNGELINFSAISRDCALPVRTVQSYYEILEDTLIGYRLQPWLKSTRKRMSAHPKFYLFDTGVCSALNRRLSSSLTPSQKGRAFEHLMILEVMAQISYCRSEARPFFWRTSNGIEVDLLIEKHGKISGAFEFKTSSTIDKSHFSGLQSFAEEYPDTPLHLVSLAEESYNHDRIKVFSWKEFLSGLHSFL